VFTMALPRMSDDVAPDEIVANEAPLSRTETSKSKKTGPIGLLRNAGEAFVQANPPVGMFAAFGEVGSNIPTLGDIKNGSFSSQGWSGPGQRRNSTARRDSDAQVMLRRQSTMMSTIQSEPTKLVVIDEKKSEGSQSVVTPSAEETVVITARDPNVPYENGYQFPPKHTWKQATVIALHGSWNFVRTPFGFLLTIYSLNIVAWGGMLFLILCRATPAMAHPNYNSWDSGAKTWLEIDSQILNALFCVTGLGLIPWRFRDWYYLLKWRYRGDGDALRRLAGIHQGWFRLQGSQEIDVHYQPDDSTPIPPGIPESALALPVSLSPGPPLTGERAPPSVYWKLDFVIWAMVWNTFLQCVLCGLMWGMNKYNRPSWSVGLFISLACIVASAGGWVIFKEGKRVKRIEGVPVSEADMEILKEMRERERASNGTV
jgi:hypothetical protein